MTRDRRPLSYVETHAGRGLYDLNAEAAHKTGEAAAGVQAMVPGKDPFWRMLAACRAQHGPMAYPGSPWIARHALRRFDRLTLFELHPAEFPALRRLIRGPNIRSRREDGLAGALALAPPSPRRGLVLIDPSYEVKADYAAIPDFLAALIARWDEAVILLWYPLLQDDRHAAMTAAIADSLPPGLSADEQRFPDPPARGMQGSGLILINTPRGFQLQG